MSFEALLRSLHQEYLAGLPKKITTIRAQLDDTTALRESFHKLKGTGRTYGMPEISELAGTLEQICVSNPDKAKEAASSALEIMQEIYVRRSRGEAHDLDLDPRYPELRKLLQN